MAFEFDIQPAAILQGVHIKTKDLRAVVRRHKDDDWLIVGQQDRCRAVRIKEIKPFLKSVKPDVRILTIKADYDPCLAIDSPASQPHVGDIVVKAFPATSSPHGRVILIGPGAQFSVASFPGAEVSAGSIFDAPDQVPAGDIGDHRTCPLHPDHDYRAAADHFERCSVCGHKRPVPPASGTPGSR